MAHPKPRPGILEISPYIGGEGRLQDFARPVRLASNENALGCSPLARAAYLKAADELHRYPDGAAAGLRAAIAQTHGMDADRIVCGAGSDELISLLIRAYAGAGDEIVYSRHGFLMYPIGAKAAGAQAVAVPEKDLKTDIDAVLAAVTPKTKIVFLANPNNPTGSYLSKAEMKKLCDGLRQDIVLVIDAAYAEYVTEKDYEEGRALVDQYPNVAMLRTFSKIHGLAALRLGWGYFPAEMAGIVNRVRGPFNTSVPAQAAGIAALSDKDFIDRSIRLAAEGRAVLAGGLTQLGIKVYPATANFILADFGAEAEKIRLGLRDKGVFIRQMGAYHLPTCLRITTGTAADHEILLKELGRLLG